MKECRKKLEYVDKNEKNYKNECRQKFDGEKEKKCRQKRKKCRQNEKMSKLNGEMSTKNKMSTKIIKNVDQNKKNKMLRK